MKLERAAREQGVAIAGFYHSHPDHPAQWSETDFNEAHWLGCSYVITAIENGVAAITNAFVLNGASEETKTFAPESLILGD
jgi:proteasome lid subunit RPN8/RPN11